MQADEIEPGADHTPYRPDLSPWFVALTEQEAPLDLPHYFEAPQPTVLDVGCGRGLFLYNASQQRKNCNFLGIEIDFKEGRRGATRLSKLQQPNARVVGGDVNLLLEKYLVSQCLHEVHVYFPDPWWKKRHHKRRVVTDDFLKLVTDRLVEEGEFHLWTDVFDYWEMARGVIESNGNYVELPAPEEHMPDDEMDYQTSFERKKRLAGWHIYRGLWKKKPGV